MYPNPSLSSALPLAAVAELELLLGKEAPLDAAAASSFPDALLEDSKRNRPRPLLLVSGTPPAARNQRNQRGASPPTPMTPLFGEDDDDAFTPSSSSPQRKQASASSWVQRAKHGSHRRRQREAAPAASRLGVSLGGGGSGASGYSEASGGRSSDGVLAQAQQRQPAHAAEAYGGETVVRIKERPGHGGGGGAGVGGGDASGGERGRDGRNGASKGGRTVFAASAGRKKWGGGRGSTAAEVSLPYSERRKRQHLSKSVARPQAGNAGVPRLPDEVCGSSGMRYTPPRSASSSSAAAAAAAAASFSTQAQRRQQQPPQQQPQPQQQHQPALKPVRPPTKQYRGFQPFSSNFSKSYDDDRTQVELGHSTGFGKFHSPLVKHFRRPPGGNSPRRGRAPWRSFDSHLSAHGVSTRDDVGGDVVQGGEEEENGVFQ